MDEDHWRACKVSHDLRGRFVAAGGGRWPGPGAAGSPHYVESWTATKGRGRMGEMGVQGHPSVPAPRPRSGLVASRRSRAVTVSAAGAGM